MGAYVRVEKYEVSAVEVLNFADVCVSGRARTCCRITLSQTIEFDPSYLPK